MTTLTFETADGLTLVADVWGSQDRPAVVLAHGGGQTRHAWGETARQLGERGWYALTLDLRGHGDSSWSPDGNYTLSTFARDLATVAATFPRPPAVVGASLGGISALIAQGEAPPGGSPFSSLVLVDITPTLNPEGVERIVGFMTAHMDEGFASMEEAADVIARYLPHRPRPRDLTGLSKNLRLGPDGRYRWHWDPRFVNGKLRPGAGQNAQRLAAASRALRSPVLLVRGRMSDLVSEEDARTFLQLVPHAQFVDVTGAGHMVAGDRNDAFTESVVDFLDTLAEPESGGGA